MMYVVAILQGFTLLSLYNWRKKLRDDFYCFRVYHIASRNTRDASSIAEKNGITESTVFLLNPGMKFPVRFGTKVRVR